MNKVQLTAFLFEAFKDKGFTPHDALTLARTIAESVWTRKTAPAELQDIAEVLLRASAELAL